MDVEMKCPTTQTWVRTGMGVGSEEQFQSNSYTNCSFTCSSCGQMHTWSSGDPDIRVSSGSPFHR